MKARLKKVRQVVVACHCGVRVPIVYWVGRVVRQRGRKKR
jgi:hypothetical protein